MTQRDKRLVIVLGTIMVLALGFLVLKSHGSGSSSATPASAASAGPTSPSPFPSPTRTKGDAKAAPLTEGRDPFVNLFAPPSPEPPPTVAPSTSPTAIPTVSPSGSPSPTPSGGSSATIGGKVVTLLSVFNQNSVLKVLVDVAGTEYTAASGETFSTGYQVAAIAAPCADFTWETDSFRLCAAPPTSS